MATEIWKSLNFTEAVEEKSLVPKESKISLKLLYLLCLSVGWSVFVPNHSICYGFPNRHHFALAPKFKMAAEIWKSLGRFDIPNL